MSFASQLKVGLVAIAGLIIMSSPLAASGQVKNSTTTKAEKVTLGGVVYVHRWSKNGQNEFTPENDRDLKRWHDMVTLNVHEATLNGEQLADVANAVLSNYEKHGKIVRTDSKPRTQQRSAEHLIVAVLGNDAFLEAAFARVMLRDGVGVIAVYSHRVYGKDAAATMGEWLKTRGPAIESGLMAWDRIPSVGALKSLPQS